MEDYFDSEIQYLNNEILRLKTSAQKSAIVTSTTAKSTNINMSLQLDSDQVTATASKTYKINIDPDSLIMITLNKYYDDITKAGQYPRLTREFSYVLKRKTNGDYLVDVDAIGTGADVTTLKNGGTVNVSITMTIRCTNDFTVEAQ